MKYFLTHRIIVLLQRPYQLPREMSAKNIMILDIKPQFTAEYIANLLWKREIAKVSSITFIPQIQNGEISHIAYINIDSFCETEAAYDFVHNMSADHFIFCHDESDVNNPDNLWILEKNTHNSGNLYVGPYTTAFAADFFKYDVAEDASESESIPDDDSNWDSDCDHKGLTPPPEVQGSTKKLMEWMEEVGLLKEPEKEPATTLCFGENLLPHHEPHYNADQEDTYTCDSEEWEEFRRKRPIKGLGNDYYSVDEALEHLWVINEHLDNEPRFSERLKLEEELEHFEKVLRVWENNEGFDIAQEALRIGRELTMSQICPSLFVPHSVQREVAGEWYEDMQRSSNQTRREVAMSVDEYNSNLRRQVARGVDELDL